MNRNIAASTFATVAVSGWMMIDLSLVRMMSKGLNIYDK